MPATAVTPSGVRDGDPAALAGLCARRGAAVLAYCRHVAGEQAAAAAAAEAFAEFRVAVVAAQDLTGLNPEALLINAARRAAARRAGGHPAGVCADVPRLLAARADRSISVAELERLEVHLLTCVPCREPVARFQAAERAYRDPPETSVAPQDAAVIVAALAAAAPVRGADDEPPPIETAAPPAPDEPPPIETPPPPAPDEPPPIETPPPAPDEPPPIETAAPPAAATARTADDPAPPPVEVAALPPTGVRLADGEPPPVELPALTAAARNGAGHLTGPAHDDDAALADTPTTELRTIGDLELDAPTGVDAAPTREGGGRRRRAKAAMAVGALRARGPLAGASPPKPARAARTRHLPRPPRIGPAAAGAPSGRGPLRPAFALPIALVGLALLAALFVAGVFGAGDRPSGPEAAAPTAAPPRATTTPEVVVVPGAREASAAAVERAKARARARRRRAAKLDSTSPTPVSTPPRAAAGSAAPARPAPAATKHPASDSGGDAPRDSGATGIDANSDATGAEQLPPAKDTSTVPELAPPTDPVAPPG